MCSDLKRGCFAKAIFLHLLHTLLWTGFRSWRMLISALLPCQDAAPAERPNEHKQRCFPFRAQHLQTLAGVRRSSHAPLRGYSIRRSRTTFSADPREHPRRAAAVGTSWCSSQLQLHYRCDCPDLRVARKVAGADLFRASPAP